MENTAAKVSDIELLGRRRTGPSDHHNPEGNGWRQDKPEDVVRYEEKVNYTNDVTVPLFAQFLGLDLASTLARDGISLVNAQAAFENSLPGISGAGDNNSVPRAFLNYIVFDGNWTAVASHKVQVSSSAGFEPGEESAPDSHEMLADSVVVPASGYI